MSDIKRKLTKISFDFDKAHLALTDKSAGGACSLMNDPIILKSLEDSISLSAEQKRLLKLAGYDVSEVEKSMEEFIKSSTSDDVISEGVSEVDNFDKSKEKGNDENMSEKLEKELADLRKELAISKTENMVSKYNLEADVAKSFAEAIALVENQEAVFKAIDSLIDAHKAELDKAKEDFESELDKAKSGKQEEEENPLAKALDEEAGEGGEPEGEVQKSRSDKIAEYLD